ncbi:MAG: hypothetical protein ACYDBZ_02175 [Steroidobacteraceae bacterium]
MTSAQSTACRALLLSVAWSAGSNAAPGAVDLARCAGIAAPDARLACYDALAGRPADRVSPAATSHPAPPVSPAIPAPSPAPPPVARSPQSTSTAPAVAALAAGDPANFGLSPARMHTAPAGPASIQARVTKISESSLGVGHPSVALDNGQTWTFTETDDDARLGPGDQVTIKRAALGSFVMTTPSKHSYHVRRVQ